MLAQSDICVTVKKNLNLPNLFSEGKRAVVGYEDGTVRVWDLKQGNAIHVIKGGNGGLEVAQENTAAIMFESTV